MQQRNAAKKFLLFLLFYFDQKFQQFTIQSKIILKVYLDLQLSFLLLDNFKILCFFWKIVVLWTRIQIQLQKKFIPIYCFGTLHFKFHNYAAKRCSFLRTEKKIYFGVNNYDITVVAKEKPQCSQNPFEVDIAFQYLFLHNSKTFTEN